jgi:two-component system NtrC family sensor kinase
MEPLRHLMLSDGFLPHGCSYLWTPRLVELHVIPDALIAISYLPIPVTLVYFIRKRRDIPFSWMFLCFGAFIVACGATHLMESWTIWFPTYWISGGIKAFTASVSAAAAILLIRATPQVLALPGTRWLIDLNQKRKISKPPVSVWPSFTASCRSTADRSGLNPRRGRAPRFSLR